MRSLTIPGILLILAAGSASAQLGRQQGLVEPNIAPDSAMLRVSGLDAAIIESLKSARPIMSVTTLDSILASKALSRAQRTDLYGKMFVHVDINRGTDAELMLIPGMDAAKVAAIKAARPWTSFERLGTVLGRSANATEAARVEQYLFIPIALNTFTNDIMDTFAPINVGTTRWKREFAEYRPWVSMEQFDREIGKYIRSRPDELKRLARYVFIDK